MIPSKLIKTNSTYKILLY